MVLVESADVYSYYSRCEILSVDRRHGGRRRWDQEGQGSETADSSYGEGESNAEGDLNRRRFESAAFRNKERSTKLTAIQLSKMTSCS